jgi:hypothetical protein
MQVDHDGASGPSDEETAVDERRVHHNSVFVTLELGNRVSQNLHYQLVVFQVLKRLGNYGVF